MTKAKPILVEISPGELFDKITVLLVKNERMTDPTKLANIHAELETLQLAREGTVPPSSQLDQLEAELKTVNAQLYDVIDGIYACERSGADERAFIRLAREVYSLNDLRALLKRRINLLLGSRLIEEKGHYIGT